MGSTKKFNEVFKPQHQVILENQADHDIHEIRRAQKDAKIEASAAQSLNMTVEAYRIKLHTDRVEYTRRMNSAAQTKQELTIVPYVKYAAKVREIVEFECEAAGGKFEITDQLLRIIYNDVCRYFYWDNDINCHTLDKRKNVLLFGTYGCGKSILVKANYSALNYFNRGDNWDYFHVPTLINKAIEEKSIKPLGQLFDCRKNMIIDEFGDPVEKQRIYGDEIQGIRAFALDLYDKWLSNKRYSTSRKVVFTSNLFPDRTYFYTQRPLNEPDNRPTIENFYDAKLANKMLEMCNLVRFPNISFRVKNKTELI